MQKKPFSQNHVMMEAKTTYPVTYAVTTILTINNLAYNYKHRKHLCYCIQVTYTAISKIHNKIFGKQDFLPLVECSFQEWNRVNRNAGRSLCIRTFLFTTLSSRNKHSTRGIKSYHTISFKERKTIYKLLANLNES
ncbi:DNA topoisomerase 2-alpha [Platysternon megacephalum]|uniref:DNA topoisomerase 2-alpha n=1 Tax=Platysternon megacephalum TaxID=55544 RepID=A0A4D9EVD6_9SAUR|nr:DNA topoisomerase 2-alpha [Platysternon megacephalum]